MAEGAFGVIAMAADSSRPTKASLFKSDRIDVASSWTAGCCALVESPTRIGSPARACSNGAGGLVPLDLLNLEAGLIGGDWTTIVSSSTDVASVAS